jgi:hypothetical protein
MACLRRVFSVRLENAYSTEAVNPQYNLVLGCSWIKRGSILHFSVYIPSKRKWQAIRTSMNLENCCPDYIHVLD